MKTLLVATDFSAAASNAANYAAKMALAINADLLLLYVYQIPVTYSEIPVAINIDETLNDAENTINELKEQLVQSAGGKLNIETAVRTGVFFQELKMLCQQVIPYAVVMGSQGTTTGERLIFGAHTTYAMRHLQWPLIAVPPNAHFSSVKQICLACDLNKVVDTVPLDEIKILVTDLKARLHVLHTGKKNSMDPELVFQSGLLQEMLLPLQPAYHFIEGDDTDEAIMNFTEKSLIDLLIVIHKKHNLLDQIVHRSHTKNMILHSHVPVMALHE